MSRMWRHAQTVIGFPLRRLVACNGSDASPFERALMNEHSARRKLRRCKDKTPPFGGVCKCSVAALAIP
jgi:hypothetical protein